MNGRELLERMVDSAANRKFFNHIIGRMKDMLHLYPSENDLLAEDDDIEIISADLVSI